MTIGLNSIRRTVLVDTPKHIGHQLTRIFSVVIGLQIDPALRIAAENGTQAKRGVYAGGAQAFDDFIDAPSWLVYRLGKNESA